MKTYIATTGTIFGLLALSHVWRCIAERQSMAAHPGSFALMAGLGGVAAVFALWAMRLLRRPAGA